MTHLDELRLMTKVAHLYHQEGLPQRQIAERLDLSQATISRLLKRALQEEIVRITISPPPGVCSDLEQGLQQAYDLKEAIVVDVEGDEDRIRLDLGAAAAYYVESTLHPDEVVGVSSWSTTLLAMVDAMQPLTHDLGAQVVQILGGVGSPASGLHANQLTTRLATRLHAAPHFLPAPGVVGSGETVRVLTKDPYVAAALALFDQVTLALVGIGTPEPLRQLPSSENVFTRDEFEDLRRRGAVGDICLRFIDGRGQRLISPLDARVIGMPLDQLRRVRRSVAIAGGPRKLAAIRGALAGRWINVLVTDRNTAERLAKNP